MNTTAPTETESTSAQGPRRARRRALAGGLTAAALAVGLLSGCGSSTTTTATIGNAAAVGTQAGGQVEVVVTSPTSGSVIAGDNVTVRGTVSPSDASVEVQGQPAVVGNGVFTAGANLHGGKTTIDVIASRPGDAPGSATVVVAKQSEPRSQPTRPVTTPAQTATPEVAYESASDRTPCGGDLAVGPHTTCLFAEEVRATYELEGPGSYEVFSPVTDLSYLMTCTGGGPVVCTGGNGASVYFD